MIQIELNYTKDFKIYKSIDNIGINIDNIDPSLCNNKIAILLIYSKFIGYQILTSSDATIPTPIKLLFYTNDYTLVINCKKLDNPQDVFKRIYKYIYTTNN